MRAFASSTMTWPREAIASEHPTGASEWPVLICVLGSFQLLRDGRAIRIRGGRKTEALLCRLALDREGGVPREILLEALWPNHDGLLASQSLNSLIYRLHRLLADALGGAGPVVYAGGHYRLNVGAGVGVDAAWFEALISAAEQCDRTGDHAAAVAVRSRAVRLYRGDLCGSTDVCTVIERERLRAQYLTLLAHLAHYYYDEGAYSVCLDHALRLLARDPCREDAHRLVMRCYVRLGERSQALRQYRLCADVLRAEFDAPPEPATTALFEPTRLDPGRI